MMSKTMVALALWLAVAAHAGELVVDAEVMEGAAVELQGPTSGTVRYAVLHHKHQKDQAAFAAWLQQHGGAAITFQAKDGAAHQAVLQRLKHCFGRGLLLYSERVELQARDVIRLRLTQD